MPRGYTNRVQYDGFILGEWVDTSRNLNQRWWDILDPGSGEVLATFADKSRAEAFIDAHYHRKSPLSEPVLV